MRNKPFSVPVGEKYILNKNKPGSLLSLKNKSSGKRLFRCNYYNLLTGDFSVLQNNKNKWFLQEILSAGSDGDINLIPALKKIASDPNAGEVIRKKSTEIAEILEAEDGFAKTDSILSAAIPEEEKLVNARKILAGKRVPQTTEILRLLRDKSVEAKRLAIYMIGKFRLTDMLTEVCDCLNIPGMEEDSIAVLRSFGPGAGNEMRRFYLKVSGNTGVCKNILGILTGCGAKEDTAFIFERLWSNSRQIKEYALDCLIAIDFRAPEEEKHRLYHLINEIAKLLTFVTSAKIYAGRNNNELLYKSVCKEDDRWKSFLTRVLSVTFSHDNFPGNLKNGSTATRANGQDLLKTIPEVVEIIFSKPRKQGDDLKFEEKKLRKLQRYFPKPAQGYYEVIEDLINFDYNLISVWTKACTLRSLPGIPGEDLVESVVALLFSPESILQEEAVRLVARSDNRLYNIASRRISDRSRMKLDKISSGKADENELLFEKTKFLSSNFIEIPEDDLLFLAGAMNYYESISGEMLPYAEGSIIWPGKSGKTIPRVIILRRDDAERPEGALTAEQNVGFYILDMEAVEAFYTQFPERVFYIMKYIDDNEK